MVAVMDIAQLQTGEKQYGEYLVQIARPSGSGWVAGIPPITARITTRRLILVPQTRKPYPPASIPGIHMLKVSNILLGQRRAVQIHLKIGYNLNLFVGWGQGEDFAKHLERLLIPSLRGRYVPMLTEEELLRLIEQISQL